MNVAGEPFEICFLTEIGETSDSLFWTICSDGSGVAYDSSYNDTVDFSHSIDLGLLEELRKLPQTELASFDGYTFDEGRWVKNYRKIGDGIDLTDLTDIAPEAAEALLMEIKSQLECIFEAEVNPCLQNAVGGCEEDEELSLDRGSDDQFETAIACVGYLASLPQYGIDCSQSEMVFYPTAEDTGDDEYPEALEDLVHSVLEAFRPRGGVTYEYIDQNDGRVTAYAACHTQMSLVDGIDVYLPSARERLMARRTLADLLTEFAPYALATLDRTFPVAAAA